MHCLTENEVSHWLNQRGISEDPYHQAPTTDLYLQFFAPRDHQSTVTFLRVYCAHRALQGLFVAGAPSLDGCRRTKTSSLAMPTKHRIFTTPFADVYPHYVAKAEKKGRTKAEVDAIIRWLTGYSHEELEAKLENQTDFETFFQQAPKMNPSRTLIKGTVCGVRVEDIQEPSMREIRYLDKLVDELAKGKTMDKILRA